MNNLKATGDRMDIFWMRDDGISLFFIVAGSRNATGHLAMLGCKPDPFSLMAAISWWAKDTTSSYNAKRAAA